LLRGINVGRAKRVAMADLRALVERLGYRDVRTLLNSGNVVFTAPALDARAAARIEEALAKKGGVSARVTVITARDLAAVVTKNPLLDVATNPSRLFVAFPRTPADRRLLAPLAKREWKPEQLGLGPGAAYVWCPDGMIESPLMIALARQLGEGVTTRNWATVQKLHALAQANG
jgi:uncharacterized protein (DUF1697 family)